MLCSSQRADALRAVYKNQRDNRCIPGSFRKGRRSEVGSLGSQPEWLDLLPFLHLQKYVAAAS